ncbi:MAG: hypothetical protein OXU61_02220, partial [Gammaproteobacteria bacterium]|nr:hypothetical protein [Gammaproteobacteria bacterium]
MADFSDGGGGRRAGSPSHSIHERLALRHSPQTFLTQPPLGAPPHSSHHSPLYIKGGVVRTKQSVQKPYGHPANKAYSAIPMPP